ncbi:MAG: methyl-accepting chemotaxis protein [Rhodospirillaceae bacterium]
MSALTSTIKGKLLGIFCLMFFLFAAFAGISTYTAQQLNAQSDEISGVWLAGTETLGRLKAEVAELRIKQARHIMDRSEAEWAKTEQNLKDINARVDGIEAEYEKTIVWEEDRKLFNEYKKQEDLYYDLISDTIKASRANDDQAAADAFVGKSFEAYTATNKALDDLIKLNQRGAATAIERAASLYDTTLWAIAGAIALVVGIVVWATLFASKNISAPIGNITNVMSVLADGNKTVTIPYSGRKDEIGAMAAAVQVFKDNMIKADELAAAQEAARKAKELRAEQVAQRTRQFDNVVRMSLGSVGSASKQMEASASTMQAVAEETNVQSSAVAAASEQAASNVQTVAAATEELTSSIKEIGRQVTQSSQVSAKAVNEANRAKDMVRGLDDSAQKIGKVVALITDIAEQTNLLALNATIEAARAGEAGKGFAVVASEVKNLANQTAKATEEIAAQINDIQGATKSSVGAIESIFETIGQIDQISTTIASAIEEQTAATAEIARNVEQAAAGTQEVSSNITGVTKAAGETGQVSTQVFEAAKELGRQSDSLRKEVDGFLADIKEAA